MAARQIMRGGGWYEKRPKGCEEPRSTRLPYQDGRVLGKTKSLRSIGIVTLPKRACPKRNSIWVIFMGDQMKADGVQAAFGIACRKQGEAQAYRSLGMLYVIGRCSA